jgi:integrase
MGKKLTAREVDSITKAGRTAVSESLYLQIDRRHGGKSWVYRYRDKLTGKLRDKGLGRYDDLSLKDARSQVEIYRNEVKRGIDPITSRREALAAQKAGLGRVKTFGECLEAYLAVHSVTWSNKKHAEAWPNTLKAYASKLLKLPVTAINKNSVLDVLTPIWTTKTETATRVRQRIESVIDFAKSKGDFQGDNPAAWSGNLEGLLANPAKLKDVKHQPALPYKDMAEFMALLESKGAFRQDGMLSIKALALIVLTATRNSEAVRARWEEFDLDARTWTVPKTRTKSKQPHTVPLSDKAIEILTALQPRSVGFVFPSGDKGEKPITIAATLKACKELNRSSTGKPYTDAEDRVITVHGFRSTFRNWAGALSSYPRDVAEAALAHANKDKTEAAYLRDKLLEKRRSMMNDWADFCFSKTT